MIRNPKVVLFILLFISLHLRTSPVPHRARFFFPLHRLSLPILLTNSHRPATITNAPFDEGTPQIVQPPDRPALRATWELCFSKLGVGFFGHAVKVCVRTGLYLLRIILLFSLCVFDDEVVEVVSLGW